ncbi:hypothetical protein BCR44DRAFT_73113 [Catenaria anguillulae PL171]|uniref:Uncharacterized protein n=1 Tax=Catenaria anguillulae PL171 TaxID=765915 RepID=A0A1Y2HE08_9FUNG|nr:hypothetical protein BCR44DRAFT_73113 [Catenaria anguillulae PL171]
MSSTTPLTSTARGGHLSSRGGARGHSSKGRGHKFHQALKRPDYLLYRRELLPIYPKPVYEHHSFASLLHTTYASFRGRREQLRKQQERMDKLNRRRQRYGDPRKPKLIIFDDDADDQDKGRDDVKEVDQDNEADLDPRERRRRELAKVTKPSLRQLIFNQASASDHTADLVGGVDLDALHAMDKSDWAKLERMRADLLADLFDTSTCSSSSSTVIKAEGNLAVMHVPQIATSSSSSQLSHVHKRSTLVATNDNKHDWIVQAHANPFPLFAHQRPVATVALSALPAYDSIARRLNQQARDKREHGHRAGTSDRDGEDEDEDAMSVDTASSSDSDSTSDSDADERFEQVVNMWVPPASASGSSRRGKVVQVDGVSGKIKSGANWLPKAAGVPANPVPVVAANR